MFLCPIVLSLIHWGYAVCSRLIRESSMKINQNLNLIEQCRSSAEIIMLELFDILLIFISSWPADFLFSKCLCLCLDILFFLLSNQFSTLSLEKCRFSQNKRTKCVVFIVLVKTPI